jgi:hypothetical protein
VAPSGETVSMTFNHFDLDGSTNQAPCRDYDWVSIYNGPNLNAPLMNQYCSSHKPAIGEAFHTTGNEAIVIFKSDKSGEKTGFSMTWQADDGGCGNQMLQAKAQIFKHHNSLIENNI